MAGAHSQAATREELARKIAEVVAMLDEEGERAAQRQIGESQEFSGAARGMRQYPVELGCGAGSDPRTWRDG